MKESTVSLYTKDFLDTVQEMSMEERGQYITMLCLQREKGHFHMVDIEAIVGPTTPEVMSHFQTDAVGRRYNVLVDAGVI